MCDKYLLMVFCAIALMGQVGAQGQSSFAQQQAYAEMQRVTGQIDVLQNNFDDLQRRVGRLEGNSQSQSLRMEIDALKSAIAELRREMSNQRGEIVRDLSGRIAQMQKPAPAPAKPSKPAYTGALSEYTVKSGDSLYMVALAFQTTVDCLRELNNLKSNNLRVGQKLLVPRVKE